MNLFPQKGRSEGDASTKVIASLTAFTTRKPQKEQNLLIYICSIIPGKESNQRMRDKVENEATSEQTRTSTNLRREERK